MMMRQQGYSLLELSLALAVMGALALAAVLLAPRFTGVLHQHIQQSALSIADHALTGFALAHSRLPCPDTNGDGNEDCGVANMIGTLPWRTLGVAAPLRNGRDIALRYGVYRKASGSPAADADLAVLKNRYLPFVPATVIAPSHSNGLDFCTALRVAALAPGGAAFTHLGAGDNIAYAIADPGVLDADGVNGLLDGKNGQAGKGFERPSRAASSVYDDAVVAVGFNELSARLGCPESMGKVNGLARSVFAADDMRQAAVFYKQFRDFWLLMQQANVTVAQAGQDIAIANLTIATALSASALWLAAQTGGIAALDVALAAKDVALATAALVQAVQGLAGANADLATALAKQGKAATALTNAITFFNQRLVLLQQADARGLLQ